MPNPASHNPLRMFATDVARHSSVLMYASHILRKRKAITLLADLDLFFDDFGKRYPTFEDINDQAVEELLGHYYVEKELRLPRDPFSEEYAEKQWAFFLKMSGRAQYDINDEGNVYDFEKNRDSFYPFNTGSPDIVGRTLLSQSMAIRAMNLSRGAKVVEFGPGWGNITVNLALMGYAVTAVEANQPFIDLINYRAGKHGMSVNAVKEDMTTFAGSTTETFDAALFVASFHHCRDHLKMLESLSRIVKKGGCICLCEEPIFYSRNPFLPYPWGLRLDGLSLYFVRKFGWLETGFQFGYLSKALSAFNFEVLRIPSYMPRIADLIVGRRN